MWHLILNVAHTTHEHEELIISFGDVDEQRWKGGSP